MIKNITKKIFNSLGYKIIRANTHLDSVTWAHNPDFNAAYNAVKPFTMLSPDRLFSSGSLQCKPMPFQVTTRKSVSSEGDQQNLLRLP